MAIFCWHNKASHNIFLQISGIQNTFLLGLGKILKKEMLNYVSIAIKFDRQNQSIDAAADLLSNFFDS